MAGATRATVVCAATASAREVTMAWERAMTSIKEAKDRATQAMRVAREATTSLASAREEGSEVVHEVTLL
jgi:hypothetical protein